MAFVPPSMGKPPSMGGGFDLEGLLNDPTFNLGIGLLSAAGPQPMNVGFGQRLGMATQFAQGRADAGLKRELIEERLKASKDAREAAKREAERQAKADQMLSDLLKGQYGTDAVSRPVSGAPSTNIPMPQSVGGVPTVNPGNFQDPGGLLPRQGMQQAPQAAQTFPMAQAPVAHQGGFSAAQPSGGLLSQQQTQPAPAPQAARPQNAFSGLTESDKQIAAMSWALSGSRDKATDFLTKRMDERANPKFEPSVYENAALLVMNGVPDEELYRIIPNTPSNRNMVTGLRGLNEDQLRANLAKVSLGELSQEDAKKQVELQGARLGNVKTGVDIQKGRQDLTLGGLNIDKARDEKAERETAKQESVMAPVRAAQRIAKIAPDLVTGTFGNVLSKAATAGISAIDLFGGKVSEEIINRTGLSKDQIRTAANGFAQFKSEAMKAALGAASQLKGTVSDKDMEVIIDSGVSFNNPMTANLEVVISGIQDAIAGAPNANPAAIQAAQQSIQTLRGIQAQISERGAGYGLRDRAPLPEGVKVQRID